MKKYIIIGAALAGFAIAGCKKSYLDINQNPNSPTEASISADLILPNSQARMGSFLGATGTYRPVAHWTGQWVRGGDFGANNQEERYDLPTTFGQGLWNGLYDILQDVNIMETKAAATGQNFYVGAAKVLKVEGFRQLVDMFNNVPYSKAFDLGGNILPAYDKGDVIYVDLFKQLDDAIVSFNKSVPGESIRTNVADIMFAGNTTKWKQYINTLRLKMILRLSQTNNSVVMWQDQMAKMTSDGYIPSGSPASVQPGYIVTAGKLNPFWNNYKTDENGIEADKFNRANPYVLTRLTTATDIRYQYYFSKAKTPISGQDYRAGEPYGAAVATTASDAQSNVAGPGLAKSNVQAQWVLTSIESLFLQSEARARGYITTGASAESLFNDGIRASFTFLGVPNATVEANILIASAQAAYTYPVGGTLAAQVKAIIEQKYLSLVGMSAFDIYSDYRRTGFPVVPLSANPQRLANVPVRYPYPQNEYNFNAKNVIAEGTINPITSKVFWNK